MVRYTFDIEAWLEGKIHQANESGEYAVSRAWDATDKELSEILLWPVRLYLPSLLHFKSAESLATNTAMHLGERLVTLSKLELMSRGSGR